jgi:hypothetical protein
MQPLCICRLSRAQPAPQPASGDSPIASGRAYSLPILRERPFAPIYPHISPHRTLILVLGDQP